MKDVEIKTLVGKTLIKIVGKKGDDTITFDAADGSEFVMYHRQDCCESVSVEDICGNPDDLVGTPILSAEESSSDQNPEGVVSEYTPESQTWTFYRIATVKGSVVIRWLGTSNGYYSEGVTFAQIR